MAKLALNKSSLQKQKEQMRLYEKLLPSLDLKRKQLSAELKKAEKFLREKEARAEAVIARTGQELPMLAYKGFQVSGLVQIKKVNFQEENIVGVKLPLLVSLDCEISEYSFFAKGPWVDILVEKLKEAAHLKIDIQVAQERVKRLQYAVKKVTQRVNLFEKKLIPEAKENIKKIRIFLSDAERSAVIRSKLAKAKHAAETKMYAEVSA